MVTVNDLRHLAASDWLHAPAEQWWKPAAAQCLAAGAVQIIPSRRGTDVYLLRCWLSIPRTYQSGEDDGARFDSGNALLLHHFLQPDDDGALHDHPWNFKTTILSGGYWESRPTRWIDAKDPEELGPGLTRGVFSDVGDINERQATDLHAITELLPDTWTMLLTGPRIRSWFFHPEGQRRVPWRDYLDRLGKDVPPREPAAAS